MLKGNATNTMDFKTIILLIVTIQLHHAWATYGPRAKSGPPTNFLGL